MMIEPQLAVRLDKIVEQFIECRKAILQQNAEIRAMAALLLQLAPPLTASFDALLKDEQAKNVDMLHQLDAQLQGLRQGVSKLPVVRPN